MGGEMDYSPDRDLLLELGERYSGSWETVFAGLDYQEIEIRLMRKRGDLAILHRGRMVPISGVPLYADSVDRLGDRFMVSSRRKAAEKRIPGSPIEEDVWILDHSGVRQKAFSAGAGYSHVAAREDGQIWVGYRDQGDWSNLARTPILIDANEPACYPSPGVGRWDEEGSCRWILPLDKHSPSDMYHCYALNAGAAGTVVAVDHDNALMKLSKEGVEAIYSSAVQSPRGFAVDGDNVMLLGRYEPVKRGAPVGDIDVVQFAIMKDASLNVTSVCKALMPNGDSFPVAPRGVSSRGRSVLMNFGDPAVTYRLKM